MDAADGCTHRVVGTLHPMHVVGTEPAKGLRPLGSEIPGLIGRSAGMLHVCEQVARLGAGSAPVLIVGETGTGKELIARAIHDSGRRRAGPLVAVNSRRCRAISSRASSSVTSAVPSAER
jgi:DNA-binding NtrC family response regulator